ncbi:regulatory protein NosR [Azospirillum sp. RWY-5-1]|uniref:Regulatory protein NosR n=1 Tax=Azospirillum oleiclasticum TaxID=2735135 RepID=A0ABX2TCW5_9PROT|nr:NosR/NirI family protein [Azospirillum oleiclasticum]NYZ13706.1 regulatory protein NosR [Azospirillum oleiclasticum]NYZ20978.1 regulatory protein NosR [Azospirillum oleiclasticum]
MTLPIHPILRRLHRLPVIAALLAAVLAAALPCVPVQAAEPKLATFLARVAPAELFPGADRFGPLEPNAPAVAVYAGDRRLGYAFLNADFVNSTGYSGRPIHVVVGIGPDARITGAKLVDHHEPIVLIGIPLDKITTFINGYVGRSVLELTAQSASSPPVDVVSGATVTVLVIGDSIVRSGKRVAQAFGLGGATTDAGPTVRKTIDTTKTGTADWETLVGDGSVRRLHLTVGDVNAAFERTGRADAIARPEAGGPDDGFIDLYAALVTIPTIGRSLLGDAGYDALVARLEPGRHAIAVAGNGRYSFKGSGYVRGGIFDRFELIQGDASTRFRDRTHTRLGSFAAAGAPDFAEVGLFVLPKEMEFDPAAPWRLQLLVQRAVAALDKAFVTVDLGYNPPEKYLKAEPVAAVVPPPPAVVAAVPAEEPAEIPLWQRIWENRLADIAVVLTAIGVLTLIFFFQDPLVRRPVLYQRVRTGFLLFTLLWLGWYANAQLSVVNILTFASALRTDFQWDYFLMDPLVFILWFSVAASLLFWGRGAFCGWLCPFGALQELATKAAKALRIPQVTVPFGLHQRLWPIKYMIFLVLFGLSLHSLATAERAAEVEPFKTAIILHFMRDWWFVLFAVALLAAGLFIERFFCRYLCPLGAALAIPARLRMFDWLHRYRECGNPCRRCANECPVQAIHPDGRINPNECIQCLHCQVLYHHDRKCPVVIQKRLKRERRDAVNATDPSAAKPRAAVLSTDPATGTLTARPGHALNTPSS